ncbi:MAG: hypothetical protein BBJ57_03250 [Desulfobacterales bacterium PC51MH44]|nr:MAG: hypothetical protein BBJ57_03250 [Desulfobacterales bacterium PC51MH44]
MKRLFFIILAVLLAGCLPSTENDPNVTSSLPEKKEKRLPKKFNKQSQPPEALKLTSVLYELAAASDPENFAKEHNIFLSKERVRVYISFNPGSSISKREKVLENYNIVVEKKAGNLSRALVPINRLIPLSKESVIWSIKLPDRLIKPRK